MLIFSAYQGVYGMELISNRWMTLLYKRGIPLLLGGLALFFVVFGISSGLYRLNNLISLVIVILVMIFLTYFLWRDTAEEVYDCGDFLLVKRGRLKEKIAFKDIAEVTSVKKRGNIIVILDLAYPGKTGTRITFLSNEKVSFFNPVKKSIIEKSIAQRVNAAKSNTRMSEQA
jgi:hypothetical protein